jgi:hypothetical protein
MILFSCHVFRRYIYCFCPHFYESVNLSNSFYCQLCFPRGISWALLNLCLCFTGKEWDDPGYCLFKDKIRDKRLIKEPSIIANWIPFPHVLTFLWWSSVELSFQPGYRISLQTVCPLRWWPPSTLHQTFHRHLALEGRVCKKHSHLFFEKIKRSEFPSSPEIHYSLLPKG